MKPIFAHIFIIEFLSVCNAQGLTSHPLLQAKTPFVKTIFAAQYHTMNRGGHSIYEEIHKAEYKP